MAAEVSGEDTGSVSAGKGVAGGGGPETAHFPFYPNPTRVRVTDLGQGAATNLRHPLNTSPDSPSDISMIYPVSGGDIAGPALSATGSGGHAIILGTSSGTIGSMCYPPNSEGPGIRMSPTSVGPDGSSVFPPLPPPPPPPPGYGGLGTVDESDMQDGPEYEEEEVVFPLSAPPTNQ